MTYNGRNLGHETDVLDVDVSIAPAMELQIMHFRREQLKQERYMAALNARISQKAGNEQAESAYRSQAENLVKQIMALDEEIDALVTREPSLLTMRVEHDR